MSSGRVSSYYWAWCVPQDCDGREAMLSPWEAPPFLNSFFFQTLPFSFLFLFIPWSSGSRGWEDGCYSLMVIRRFFSDRARREFPSFPIEQICIKGVGLHPRRASTRFFFFKWSIGLGLSVPAFLHLPPPPIKSRVFPGSTVDDALDGRETVAARFSSLPQHPVLQPNGPLYPKRCGTDSF